MTIKLNPDDPPDGYEFIDDGILEPGDKVWSVREGWIDARENSVGDNVRNFYGVARAKSERRAQN